MRENALINYEIDQIPIVRQLQEPRNSVRGRKAKDKQQQQNLKINNSKYPKFGECLQLYIL